MADEADAKSEKEQISTEQERADAVHDGKLAGNGNSHDGRGARDSPAEYCERLPELADANADGSEAEYGATDTSPAIKRESLAVSIDVSKSSAMTLHLAQSEDKNQDANEPFVMHSVPPWSYYS